MEPRVLELSGGKPQQHAGAAPTPIHYASSTSWVRDKKLPVIMPSCTMDEWVDMDDVK